MKKTTFELLKPIIAAIPKTFTGKSVTDNNDGTYTILSENTLWLSPGRTVTIGLNEFTITDLMPNEWVKLKGDVLPGVSFDIYTPFPFNGTLLAQQQLIKGSIKNGVEYKPMIWLHEITPERHNADPLSNKDRDSDCDLYFMLDADFANWLTPEHEQKAVIPMRNLMFAFIEQLKESTNVDFDEIKSFETFDHANFGVYLASKGHVENTFSEYLSGTQLRITIPFLWECEC